MLLYRILERTPIFREISATASVEEVTRQIYLRVVAIYRESIRRRVIVIDRESICFRVIAIYRESLRLRVTAIDK